MINFMLFVFLTMKKAMNFHTKYDLMKKVNEKFGTVLGKNEVSR